MSGNISFVNSLRSDLIRPTREFQLLIHHPVNQIRIPSDYHGYMPSVFVCSPQPMGVYGSTTFTAQMRFAREVVEGNHFAQGFDFVRLANAEVAKFSVGKELVPAFNKQLILVFVECE